MVGHTHTYTQTLTQTILSRTYTQTFSFTFRNPTTRTRQECEGNDPQACKSIFEPTISIKYTPLSKFQFAPVMLKGDVLGGGEEASLKDVSATEEHNVQSVSNLVTFRLQANMPLSTGTKLVFTGVTQAKKPTADDIKLISPAGALINGVPLSRCVLKCSNAAMPNMLPLLLLCLCVIVP